jgi:hypothetical protein
MSIYFRDLAAQAATDGTISPEEVLILRRAGWQDGKIDADEAEAIFEVHDRIEDHSPEWIDFFVEALAEFVVNGSEPLGYVDEVNAEWLMEHIDRDGSVDTMGELELLVKLFERATRVPERLRTYAVAQIEKAVLIGEGPTRRGGTLSMGMINDTEAQLLRRLIFAPASDRPAGVSRAEAELLFHLKDATLGAANGPEWKRLFVQGVGNYLMAYTSYEPLSQERAAELEEFMTRPSDGVGRFFARMAHFDLQSGFTGVFGRRPARDRQAEEAAAHEVTGDERSWLEARIDADHEVDEYEQALMDFLAEEGGK